MSYSNYDAILTKWATKGANTLDEDFDTGNSVYTQAGAEGRSVLVNEKHWVINDGGLKAVYPKLTYIGGPFRESITNNGSVHGERKIIFDNTNTINTNTFVNRGETLVYGEHYIISPSHMISQGNPKNNLIPVMSVDNTGEFVTLTFNGRAKKHKTDDSISGLTITFKDEAFVNQLTDSLNINNKINNQGKIIFKDNTVFNPTETLYASYGDKGIGSFSYLYTLNQTTGEINNNPGLKIRQLINGVEQPVQIEAMDFHPNTRVLYGITGLTNKILSGETEETEVMEMFIINKETGVATWVGDVKNPKEEGQQSSLGFLDMTFNSEGDLFTRTYNGISPQKKNLNLYEVDYSCPNGNCIVVPVKILQWGHGVSGGLDFDSKGLLNVLEGNYVEWNINPNINRQAKLYRFAAESEYLIDSLPYSNLYSYRNLAVDEPLFYTTSAKFDLKDNLFATRHRSTTSPVSSFELLKISVNENDQAEITLLNLGYTGSEMVTAIAFDVEGEELSSSQTTPHQDGSVFLSGDTKEVVITEDSTGPIVIEIEDDVDNPILAFTSLITNNTMTLPEIEIKSSLADVYIPAGNITVINGGSLWSGEMNGPTLVTSVNLPGNSIVSKGMEIGTPGMKILFDNAVKIIMKGEAGKKVGYFGISGDFFDIPNACEANTQESANGLEAEGHCKITDDGEGNLIIWTKHFTEFVTYTDGSSTSSNRVSSGSRPVTTNPLVAIVDTTVQTTSEVPGCIPGALFSSTTGQACGTTTVTTTTVTYNLGTTSIKQGQRNNFVKELQKFLNTNLKLNLTEDGIFGAKTKAAVISFQKNNNLVSDGIVGPMTKGKIK